jgi:hypothetical protein
MAAAEQVDADWAGDVETRRSHTGFVLMMNRGPISWKSRQHTPAYVSAVVAVLQKKDIMNGER